jgi:predicted membrane protein
MDEQKIESRFKQRWEHRYQRSQERHYRQHGSRWFGVFLLVIGGLLLARASGVLFPHWFFTWPMLLIGFGILSGVRHGFRGMGWLIPIVIGGVFLADRFSPELRLRPYLWPIALIAIGLLFLLRPKRSHRWEEPEAGHGFAPVPQEDGSHRKTEWQATTDGTDFIDATAVLGGMKRNVVSKTLKGGDITTFMGGAEINLLQADFNGRVMIDCFNMFGGTKLIIPADWQIQSGLTVAFGGIEDKRPPAPANPDKVLYLDGTCIFGGIEIKSF